MTQNFFYAMFIWILYMFRETLCLFSGDNCINTPSGIITLKTIEGSKITKITRAHINLIVRKTLRINDKI